MFKTFLLVIQPLVKIITDYENYYNLEFIRELQFALFITLD